MLLAVTPCCTRGQSVCEELGHVGSYGGAPLTVAMKNINMRLNCDLPLTLEEIASADLITDPTKKILLLPVAH